MRKNYTAEEKQAVIDRYRSGVAIADIAKETALQEIQFIPGLKKMTNTRRIPAR